MSSLRQEHNGVRPNTVTVFVFGSDEREFGVPLRSALKLKINRLIILIVSTERNVLF